jgi:protein TonB
MKTLLLIAFCFTLLPSATTAQLASLDQVTNEKSVDSLQQSIDPSPTSLAVEEYAPTSNAPFFPGGQRALKKYFRDLNVYPHQARKAGIQGTVLVRFRVLATGHLSEVRVVRSRGHMLDAAAVRAVALMPRWFPAHRSGVAVASLYELPVKFDLNDSVD